MKRHLCALLAAVCTVSMLPAANIYAADDTCQGVDALQYTYEIYPFLEPLNEYFYVKTENPHPESFRFSDKDSPYSESSVIENVDALYADVAYEDTTWYRVNGGYLFKSSTTDGGSVTLQVQETIDKATFNTAIYGTPDPEYTGYSPWHGMPVGAYEKHYENSISYTIMGYYQWVDTDITFTLPALCDECDYLIETYATEDDFFSNMDAVQSGFSSICFYSGSYIRGKLYRDSDRDWHLTPAFHVDQSFYIYSPYSRKDSKSLFASTLYPYRYDSLGFPSMMGKIAQRLSAESSYAWSSTNHAFIEVTYNGETRTYGGQGNGEGQGITEDKILRTFTFGDTQTSMTLSDSRKLLEEYAAIPMEDDIPREDALTWEKIYQTIGDGAWVDMGGYYTYLYPTDDSASFYADEWGVGNSLYWWGSLGYCRDTWVDGRYVNKSFVRGATLEDHPESDVMRTTVRLPEITAYERTWDASAGKYVYTSAEVVEREFRNITFEYDAESQTWLAADAWGENRFGYQAIQTLVESGVIDSKYLDMVTLTPAEVEAMIATGDNQKAPERGFIFDGYAPQGTPFLRGDCNADGSFNMADVVLLQKWLSHTPDTELANWRVADLCEDGTLDSCDLTVMKRKLAQAIK